MITLYHGSYIAVPSPLVGLGRKKVDFGQGFYLTNLHNQAKAWAETIAERQKHQAYCIGIYVGLLIGKKRWFSCQGI